MPAPQTTPRVPRVVMGIDPSLRATGWGVIEAAGSSFRALDYGVIRVPGSKRQSRALLQIHQVISELIAKYRPSVMSVEGVIYLQNYRTAITLGAARAAALLAGANADLEIVEYAPRKIKAAATGRGGAQKDQVAFMVRAQLGLRETPAADAADALAAALAHLQNVLGPTEKSRL